MKHINNYSTKTMAVTNGIYNDLVTLLISLNRNPKLINKLRAWLIKNRCCHIAKLTDDLVNQLEYFNEDVNISNVSSWLLKLYHDELEYKKAVAYAQAKQRTLPSFAYQSFHTSNYYNIKNQYCTVCGQVLNNKHVCPNESLHQLDYIENVSTTKTNHN